jgi:hypothetical protein
MIRGNMSKVTSKANTSDYSSKKHPVLEYIFRKYYDKNEPTQNITFYLSDISEGYKAINVPEPVSISNTILDLTRQDRGIESRLPKSIYELGFDLRKKTGSSNNGSKFAGEFIYVGIGNVLKSWLEWSFVTREIVISTKNLPSIVQELVRPDEAGLFSVIDYLDIFTRVLNSKNQIVRIQNPMKWQPNEIDGFYADLGNNTVYPVEAKALTTGDEINLDQLQGGYRTVINQFNKLNKKYDIQHMAVKMIKNGIMIAVFPKNTLPENPSEIIKVSFDPVISRWN